MTKVELILLGALRLYEEVNPLEGHEHDLKTPLHKLV